MDLLWLYCGPIVTLLWPYCGSIVAYPEDATAALEAKKDVTKEMAEALLDADDDPADDAVMVPYARALVTPPRRSIRDGRTHGPRLGVRSRRRVCPPENHRGAGEAEITRESSGGPPRPGGRLPRSSDSEARGLDEVEPPAGHEDR